MVDKALLTFPILEFPCILSPSNLQYTNMITLHVPIPGLSSKRNYFSVPLTVLHTKYFTFKQYLTLHGALSQLKKKIQFIVINFIYILTF